MNTLEAVMLKVRKTRGCWIWQGSSRGNGYGIVSVNGRSLCPHRYIYEHLVGPIPKGLYLLHSCDNGMCVNPKHLRPGTQKENLADCIRRKRLWTFTCPERHFRKIPDAQVALIKERRANGESGRDLAREYGVTDGAISMIVHGKRRVS